MSTDEITSECDREICQFSFFWNLAYTLSFTPVHVKTDSDVYIQNTGSYVNQLFIKTMQITEQSCKNIMFTCLFLVQSWRKNCYTVMQNVVGQNWI